MAIVYIASDLLNRMVGSVDLWNHLVTIAEEPYKLYLALGRVSKALRDKVALLWQVQTSALPPPPLR